MRWTLNTDNRLITDTTVTDEYILAVQQWGLGIDELKWITINGFKSGFLPFREKTQIARRVVQEYDELVDQFRAKRAGKAKTKASKAKAQQAEA